MDNSELKHQRKLYRLPDLPTEVDAEVLRRRKYHEIAAALVKRWDPFFSVVFIFVGFFIVLLPAMLPSWQAYVASNIITNWIFNHFSGLGFFLITPVLVAIFLNMACDWRRKDQPYQWSIGNPHSYPSASEIIHLELYPSNKREEIAYFLNIASQFLQSVGVLGFFCVPSYFVISWR